MPDVSENKTEIAGAICAPPAEQNGVTVAPQPPRQPTNLQGLLRFAMDATKNEDASNNSELKPMDEERKKFLEDALKSMTVDVIDVMKKQITVLKKVESVKTDDDVDEYLEALDTISEYVDHIDLANDFHKIGGCMILHPCLKCGHPKIRAQICDLIAILTQNNPYMQKVVLDNDFLPVLLNLLDKDTDLQVQVKALYAISGIVRENSEGFNQLLTYNGLVVFLNALKRNQERITIKIAFLLTSLCKFKTDLKSRLIFLEYLPALIALISEERNLGREYILSLLVTLIEDNSTAILECNNSKYNLKEILNRLISEVKGKDEFMEEDQYCRRLLQLLN